RGVVLHESALQRIESLALAQSLDCLDRAPVHPYGKLAARIAGFSVNENRACAALSSITADLGAGQTQVIPQQLYDGPAILDLDTLRLAIDGNADGGTGNGRGLGLRALRANPGSGSGSGNQHASRAFEECPARCLVPGFAFAHDASSNLSNVDTKR